MSRIMFRPVAACLLIVLCAAVALADPLPAPRFPAGNVLQNGEFTDGATHWKITNPSSGDKVKCNGVGYSSDCGFQLKNSGGSTATTVSQVYKPAPTDSSAAVVLQGEAFARSLVGSSCLKFTVTVIFKNENAEPYKDTFTDCGTGTEGSWASTHEIGNTSFNEKSLKKAKFAVKHTGNGVWMVDAITLEYVDK